MSARGDDRAERDARDLVAMQRIQAGDEAAVAELYDRYAATALALALRIVRDRTEAEDVVHDAFVAIVERAEQFHAGRGIVVAWVLTTVRNAALDRSRRRARRAKIADEELRHEAPDSVLTPEVQALLARDRDAVRRALETLSEAHRSTLETAFFDGLTYPEIAERDGVPLGTVKSRAARALTALRAMLDEESPPSSA